MSPKFLSQDYQNQILQQILAWQALPEYKFYLNWDAAKILSAFNSGKVLGLEGDSQLLLASLFYRETYAGQAEIDLILVSPQGVGKGFAGCLIKELQQRFQRLLLEVHEGNEQAIKFYRKHGFREDGRRPRYYSDGGSALLMSWEI